MDKSKIRQLADNDRAPIAHTGRTQISSKGRFYRNENRCASDAGTPKAVLQMGH